MPIYERDLSYEDMKKAERSFKCARCDSILVIAWSAQENSYMLRCGQVLEHEGVAPVGRDPSILEIRNKLKGAPLPMETTALRKLDKSQMLKRVSMGKFTHQLTPVEQDLVARVSLDYGLDPLFGELQIYQSRPYITIDARRRKAQETGQLDGINARPATKEEREARRVPAEDYLFVAQVWVKGASHAFEGWGRVSQTEIDRAIAQAKAHNAREDALPIVNDPAAMAEKRAEAQGLHRAFHIPLPSFEEVIEGEFSVVSETRASTKPKPASDNVTGNGKTPPRQGTITPLQRAKIWADAKLMGYKEHEVHAIVKQKFGVGSVNDLSIAQASTFIDMVKRGEGIPGPKGVEPSDEPPALFPKEGK